MKVNGEMRDCIRVYDLLNVKSQEKVAMQDGIPPVLVGRFRFLMSNKTVAEY